MNSSSPATTGAIALSASAIGGVIVWLCTWPLHPPSVEVATTLGGVALYAGHQLLAAVTRRMTAKSTPAPEPKP